jgi:peroxiredoxin
MTGRGRLACVLLVGGLFGTGWLGTSQEAAKTKALAVGDEAPANNNLRDLRGNRRALHDFKGNSAIVLAFLGTECPVTNVSLPNLIALEKKYRPRKVQFLAVYPNQQEDLDAVAAHAYDRDLPFPVLKDFGQKLADRLGVTRVPTVVVLDGAFALRYRGRVDDRYGVAARRPQATREDLVQALDEILAGKQASVAETEADGCLIDRGSKAVAKAGVTYSKHVAPILQRSCQSCHRPDQSAPFALMSYDEAVKHGRMIKEVTSQRRMPPWHADARFGHFSNDRRLSRDEVETLAAWVDADMPRGKDEDLPPPAERAKGWVHGQPDLVIPMPEEFEVPADGTLPYKYWLVDPQFTEDKWVRVAEARPGAASVVHHIVAYIMKDGQKQPFSPDGTISILVGWAPGDLGLVCPPDTALRVPKGAKLRLELHYTPNGKATKDRSSIGLTFAKGPPKYEMYVNAFANETIVVPPHDPHYRAEATLRWRADARVLSLTPHMHWRGKDYFYEVLYPDGKKQTILAVPRWDFNWQNVYQLREPLKLPAGSRLHAVAHWDNSRNNPYNPAPDKTVRFGLQTWDEMMVGYVTYVWERPETAAELAKKPLSPADQMFDRLDQNGDDFITRDEVPEQLRPLLLLNGLPERIDRAQFAKVYEEMRKRMQKRK